MSDLREVPAPPLAPPDRLDPADPSPLGPDDALSPPSGRALRSAVLLTLAFEAVALGFLYVPMPPNPDHETYDFIAWSALEQGGLYRNAGDMNMPGELLLHVASMSAFGNHYWSYRLLDYLLLVGFAGSMTVLSRPYFGRLYGSLFFGLYLIVYTTSGYWMTGQRDLLATHAVLLAGFLYLRRAEGGGRAWLAAASAMIAVASLLKPTYLASGPLILLAVPLFLRRGVRAIAADAAIMAAVGAAVLGVVALAGWATDSLGSWFEMTVAYSSQNYVGGVGAREILGKIATTMIRSWHWYTVMALSGLVCWMSERRKAPLAVILASMATVLLSTFTQRKGFNYHFSGLLPSTTLLCSFYLAEILRLSRRIPDPKLRFSVLSFPALIVASGLFSKAQKEYEPQVEWYLGGTSPDSIHRWGFDDVLAAADYARSATRPDQTIWPYTTHLMINSLADRRMPTRLACYAFLRFRKATPMAARWRGEVEAVFRDAPPEFVVLEAPDPNAPDTFFNMAEIRPEEPLAAFKEALGRSYAPDRRIGRFAFFRRIPPSPLAEARRPD